MMRRVMVPLDGSDFSEFALPVALTLGRKAGADLDLVTVQEPLATFFYGQWEPEVQEWTRAYLAEVVEGIGQLADGRVETATRAGKPSEALLKHAEERGADLIVMATHGRGRLSRAWLGSVADAMVRHATVPLLLVRPREEEEPDLSESPDYRSILVPLDGSERAEAVLTHAISLGELFGSEYRLLRIVPFPMEIGTDYLPHTARMNQEMVEEGKREAEEYLEDVAGNMRSKGLEVSTHVEVEMQVAGGILSFAESNEVDLIALSTHGRSPMKRAVMGSVADKLIRGTDLPLLIHRPTEVG